MRTRITQSSIDGSVTLHYQDRYTDDYRERVFCAPRVDRGYVREVLEDGSTRQVCRYLACTGSTLLASRETLLETVRREWKLGREYERRLERRYEAACTYK